MIDQKTLSDLKQNLLDEKKKLEEELGLIAKKEDGEYETKFEDLGRDEEDNAEEVEEYSNKLDITEKLEKKLIEIKGALNRMENGTYGVCENCPDEEIPLERLMAYPAASTCLKCQD